MNIIDHISDICDNFFFNYKQHEGTVDLYVNNRSFSAQQDYRFARSEHPLFLTLDRAVKSGPTIKSVERDMENDTFCRLSRLRVMQYKSKYKLT